MESFIRKHQIWLFIFLIFLGLLILLIVIIKLFNNPVYEPSEALFKILLTSLGIGLVGLLGIEIFKKALEEKIKEFIEIHRKTLIEPIIEKAIEDNPELLEIKDEHTIDPNMSNNKKMDTIIVPVKRTIDEIQKYKIYRCQKDRPFYGMQYLGFYANKSIKGVAEYTKIEEKDVDANLMMELANEKYSIKDLDFYKLNFVWEGNIPHLKPYALVQGIIYSTLSSIKKAKDTSEIDRI